VRELFLGYCCLDDVVAVPLFAHGSHLRVLKLGGNRLTMVPPSVRGFVPRELCLEHASAGRVSSEVFQTTLHLAVVTRLLPQSLRGDEALMARTPPKETRAAKVARLRD
jgi:hypothetical protein